MARRVAITGLGVVTALGGDVSALTGALVDGRCGIGPLTAFVYAGRSQIAAQVPELGREVPAGLSRATSRRLSMSDRFALLAAGQACRAAGLEPAERRGAALHVGATTGGMRGTEEAYRRYRAGLDRRVRLSRVLATPLSAPAAAVSQALEIFGPRSTFSTACSSSALAIAAAADTIRRGDAPVAVAIGTDELCRLTYAGFDALQALDAEPCRPFDRNRRGLSLGEGGAALVLEDADHARARGAAVRLLLLGEAVTADAHHVTAPHPHGAGARRALAGALAAAGVVPEQIDYVNAHGSGTAQNDAIEVQALRAVLGEHLPRVPISSSKSQVGHCLGAAGAVEAVITAVALEEGLVPATVTLHEPEPAWADLDLVATAGRRRPLGIAVSSSYGFGGHNVTLVLARPEVVA